ncbi:DUF4200 domain-containing protein [Blastopirellula sp. JC732]|uniref:DUF4200 domain-containing protein n=1 Tax=Blastopirellula sediminis TaxID=2894196 RepID=A0A9X1SDV3_9BACT|nr:DUF4200 domain-containing protein [Blastopirellula sediminis]MCC9608137.1 DUF4200 domain-containing protein [Blastopirellula sediminis]MCC9627070.1 DUF4200 domain-containing protein [Blastopirellula sediminis]
MSWLAILIDPWFIFEAFFYVSPLLGTLLTLCFFRDPNAPFTWETKLSASLLLLAMFCGLGFAANGSHSRATAKNLDEQKTIEFNKQMAELKEGAKVTSEKLTASEQELKKMSRDLTMERQANFAERELALKERSSAEESRGKVDSSLAKLTMENDDLKTKLSLQNDALVAANQKLDHANVLNALLKKKLDEIGSNVGGEFQLNIGYVQLPFAIQSQPINYEIKEETGMIYAPTGSNSHLAIGCYREFCHWEPQGRVGSSNWVQFALRRNMEVRGSKLPFQATTIGIQEVVNGSVAQKSLMITSPDGVEQRSTYSFPYDPDEDSTPITIKVAP